MQPQETLQRLLEAFEMQGTVRQLAAGLCQPALKS